MVQQNSETFRQLREEYPEFVYEKYTVTEDQDKIYLRFSYRLTSHISFLHEINILRKNFAYHLPLSSPWIENLVFHLGLIELVRYWKTTCSPRVILKAGSLSAAQVSWWKTLYFKGLQEFFYVNSIETTPDDFMEIDTSSSPPFCSFSLPLEEKNLISIGGGKDSIVTLHLLSQLQSESLCFVFNPRETRMKSALIAGYPSERIVEIRRISDPKFLQMRKSGYLTGHLPFSAFLAFLSLCVAALFGTKYIIVSNESSANEGNITNTDINHQYSKSFEFEQNFNAYIHRNITEDIQYFSVLRPFNELQIAERFSRVNPEYFTAFRSCNTPNGTNQWCNTCAKCLFVYIILFPFFDEHKLVSIFGQNLFAQNHLLPSFLQLIGIDPIKPFECVGTREEVNAALSLGLRTWYQGRQKTSTTLPYLLRFYTKHCAHFMMEHDQIHELLNSYNEKHLLPPKFFDIIAQASCERKNLLNKMRPNNL